MARRVLTLAGLAAALTGTLTGPAAGQAPGTPSTRTAAEPVLLRVTAEHALLHSRADANSAAVVRVDAGTVLQAVAHDAYHWYRVLPPPGVFSYVSADLVDRRSPTEGIVSVRSGRLRVRVGSLLSTLDPERSEVQALLELGTRVQIVGEQGAWLKIAAPEGVYLYVQDTRVEPIAPDARPAPAGNQVEAASRPVQPAPATAPAGSPAATLDTSDLGEPWGQRLTAVEGQIAAENRKPLVDQDWSAALAELTPIAQQRSEPAVARLAAAWIAQLEQRVADRELVRTADEVLQRSARDQARYAREQQQLAAARDAAGRSGWTARGQLLRSYAAQPPAGRRWYRLQDPLSRRVVAYVELAADAKLDPEPLLGQYVGVRGQRRNEPALGADVIETSGLELLTPDPPASRPAAAPARQPT